MSDPQSEPAGDSSHEPGPFENLGRKLDERPEVRAAEQALRQAQIQLEKARKQYHEIRVEAAESLQNVRGHKVGDVVSATLELVRKHPGPGVVAALVCGWVAGRIFRR